MLLKVVDNRGSLQPNTIFVLLLTISCGSHKS